MSDEARALKAGEEQAAKWSDIALKQAEQITDLKARAEAQLKNAREAWAACNVAVDRAIAAEAQVARLRAALQFYATGSEWGTWLAILVNGAATRDEGIGIAKQIVRQQAVVDRLLADPEGKP